MALHRMAKQGVIRRLARGLYDYPKTHATLGPLLPSPEVIAKALAGRDQIHLQPAGAYAANLLGLSEQVPAKVVFLTEGPSRTVRLGGSMTIQLRHTSARSTSSATRTSSTQPSSPADGCAAVSSSAVASCGLPRGVHGRRSKTFGSSRWNRCSRNTSAAWTPTPRPAS